LTAQSVIRRTKSRPDLEWAGQLAAAIQVSIVGYCTAGAFVNLGFYDLFYALVAVLTAIKVVVEKSLAPELRPAPAYLPVSQPAPQRAFAPRV
jgi:hypothetical protein